MKGGKNYSFCNALLFNCRLLIICKTSNTCSYKLFSGGKSKKKRAAEVIQKYGRGWIARYFYRQFKHIVKLRDTTSKELLTEYRRHLREIIARHDTITDGDESIDLREACDYYLKLDKYELAFVELADGRESIQFEELPIYFDVLTLTPTKAEIRIAVDEVLESNAGDYLDFIYTKDIVVDIALHIFVPKGTHLQNTRKSTWLCPIVGNDDALRFGEDTKKLSMAKCMRMVGTSICQEKGIPTETNGKDKTKDKSGKTKVEGKKKVKKKRKK